MGINSVRCSYNPPPSVWMDLCDEMGIMVDDEIFDMWEKKKNKFDYSNYFKNWHEKDITNWFVVIEITQVWLYGQLGMKFMIPMLEMD